MKKINGCLWILVTLFGCGPNARGHEVVSEPDYTLANKRQPTGLAEGGEPTGRMNGIVAAHNRVRQRHCAPGLTWSDTAAKVAQKWATTLQNNGCAFEHSQTRNYGENLAFFSPASTGTVESALGGWYGEVNQYDFGAPGFAAATGHFTQVVWVASKFIGCGVAECGGGILWVCNYGPAGNVLGQFENNVKPTTCR